MTSVLSPVERQLALQDLRGERDRLLVEVEHEVREAHVTQASALRATDPGEARARRLALGADALRYAQAHPSGHRSESLRAIDLRAAEVRRLTAGYRARTAS